MTGFLTALFLKIPFPVHEYAIAAFSVPIRMNSIWSKRALTCDDNTCGLE